MFVTGDCAKVGAVSLIASIDTVTIERGWNSLSSMNSIGVLQIEICCGDEI